VKSRCTLKKNSDFRRLYAKGKCASNGYLVLYARRNRLGVDRLGYTVSVKLGHAVVRNRVRRRLREIYRLNEEKLSPGYDIVVVARVKAVHSRYDQLERQFLSLANKLGLLTPEGPVL
jgi:ribonuclease P protein component